MTSQETSDAVAVVEEYLRLYNDQDLGSLEKLLEDDVHITHHNRGIEVTNRQDAVALYGSFGQAFPDRRFHQRRRLLADGPTVVVEHVWEGRAAADVPGFAAAGEVVRMELCTLITVRDGKVAQYHDYG